MNDCPVSAGLANAALPSTCASPWICKVQAPCALQVHAKPTSNNALIYVPLELHGTGSTCFASTLRIARYSLHLLYKYMSQNERHVPPPPTTHPRLENMHPYSIGRSCSHLLSMAGKGASRARSCCIPHDTTTREATVRTWERIRMVETVRGRIRIPATHARQNKGQR